MQVVLATPALLLMLMLVFQFALYQHGAHLVTAAAQHGAGAAQVEGGSASAGESAARAFLARADRGLLRVPSVVATRSPNGDGRVVVRAQVVSLVPGFAFTVTATADGPVERFLNREQR